MPNQENDIYTVIGTASKQRVDILHVIKRHFPTHEDFVSWRDAGGHCPTGLLVDREELAFALVETALRRGAKRTDDDTCIVEFHDQISAARFRDWLRPESE
jgi:hypothetical protein